MTSLTAQDLSLFKKEMFTEKGDTLPYRILLPKDFNPEKTYPFLLFLHGAGERGKDNEAQLTHGADLFLKEENREKFPAIIVFPQCAEDSYWSSVNVQRESGNYTWTYPDKKQKNPSLDLVEGLICQLKKTYKIDKKRLYTVGLSMGGMGTFEMVWRNPKMFAAAMPICGGANPAIVGKLTRPEWWIFHGEEDAVVPVHLSKDMQKALLEVGATAKLTLYSEVNHDSWTNAFAEEYFLSWLFSKRRD
ncbi:MAG: putative peptidase [Paraglaciecola sp.]|jgi:predicted peptidase